MIRVLHVNSGNLYGGIETMLVTLARCRHLCPAMEPHFALCFEERLSNELRAAGAPVHLLGGVRVSRWMSVLRARRALKDLLQKSRYDVVICHSTWAQAIFEPAVKAAEVPLVFWLHNPADGKNWLDRWAKRARPNLVICNSRFTAESLPRIYSGVSSAMIYYPVALPEVTYSQADQAQVRTELRTSLSDTVIIQASRLEAWKGQSLLLEALSRLQNLPGWACWLVGGVQRHHEAEYLNQLKEAALQAGIADRVHFLGQRDDVPRLLAAADIHCQPNTGPEPFGIAFVEALLAGLPVVTTGIGAAKEIVEDSCGILVPPDRASGLAGALESLITNVDLRVRLGNNGPRRARALCDPAAAMNELCELLTSLSIRAVAA